MRVSAPPTAIVIGDGVVGLATALHLSANGVPTTLVAPDFSGAASPASAGMLAPSVERAQGAAQDFSDAARDSWGRMLDLSQRFGGGRFEVQRRGILRIARSESEAAALQTTLRSSDRWLSSRDALVLVPGLASFAGCALYSGDGVVDVPAALASMRAAVRRAPQVSINTAPAVEMLSKGDQSAVRLSGGHTLFADVVILASGAWSGSLSGLPRRTPVRPLRGALISVEANVVDRPVYDAEGHVYLFPRAGRTLIGATSDDVGFDATPLESDGTRLLDRAADVVPALRGSRRSAPWAGLRPMTPDGLAMIGKDPAMHGLVYACGHGRNGFLQAPLTGEVIAAIVLGVDPQFDLKPFDPARFS